MTLCDLCRSFELFVEAARSINMALSFPASYDNSLATLATTFQTTAILEAGRRSLDEKRIIHIAYEDEINACRPTKLV
jgi:D-galacturonate reductase